MAVKQKILIVDDDNNIAELISLYLTKECFETMIVGDGESALTDAARSDAAGHRWISGLPGDTRQVFPAHYHAFGERRDLRQSAGPGDGRR